jgi:hypothetical protein
MPDNSFPGHRWQASFDLCCICRLPSCVPAVYFGIEAVILHNCFNP